LLDAEWDFISAALPRLLTGDNNRLQTVCNQLYLFLDFTGRWDERIWLFNQAEDKALVSGDKNMAGWRAYQAGWTYYQRNDAAPMIACADRVAQHWTNPSPKQKSMISRLKGLGYMEQKNYISAGAALKESLEIRKELNPESEETAMALCDYASLQQKIKKN
jgi:hypothetical protein